MSNRLSYLPFQIVVVFLIAAGHRVYGQG